MRMQLNNIIVLNISLFAILFFSSSILTAQNSEYQMKENDKEVTIDFLSSYYEQDGNNSPVTGGIGTESLQDIASVIVVNIPLDSINAISVTAGADYYTSASTDMIDRNNSSASSKDVRAYGIVSYSRKNLKRNETYGIKVGASAEYDYQSVSFGLSYAKEFNNGNSEFNLAAQAFIDNWTPYIPSELRGSTSFATTSRNSFNLQASYAQVINKRMQASISAEAIYMKGLLSTPFHRVYFQDANFGRVENLPESRLKIPVGIRFNYKPTDNIFLRSYYRFYIDDWGSTAHTASLEVPIKVSDWFTLAPFARYHKQSAVDYFAPFAESLVSDEFYSADYDLSALSSQKFGLRLKISPLYGLARIKIGSKRTFQLKSINVRAAYYERDTGLTAYIASVNLSFGLRRNKQ
ncbi:DUF3570 domain-containing protein [Chitinophagales bacterium]|nr:DUF3570 domain-containing protein [Chitinophagales bacterium]